MVERQLKLDARSNKNRVRWHHFSDRKLYRPGETVRIKGWLRGLDGKPGGALIGLPRPYGHVSYTVFGPRSNKLKTGEVSVNAWGGFNLNFPLPKDANLGTARVVFHYDVTSAEWEGRNSTERIQIEEFRRPEFEVKAYSSSGPHLLGSSAQLWVKAKYYAGGALPNAAVNWTVQASPGQFTPPNHAEFSFGTWTPWWKRSSHHAKETRHFSGSTNALGIQKIKLDFTDMNPPRAMSIRGEAAVTDVNRQRWTSSTHLLVHPATHYVGLRSLTSFVPRGESIAVDAVITDLDGQRCCWATH